MGWGNLSLRQPMLHVSFDFTCRRPSTSAGTKPPLQRSSSHELDKAQAVSNSSELTEGGPLYKCCKECKTCFALAPKSSRQIFSMYVFMTYHDNGVYTGIDATRGTLLNHFSVCSIVLYDTSNMMFEDYVHVLSIRKERLTTGINKGLE